MKEFDCEHCEKPVDSGVKRACRYCGDGMCPECAETHDRLDKCPKPIRMTFEARLSKAPLPWKLGDKVTFDSEDPAHKDIIGEIIGFHVSRESALVFCPALGHVPRSSLASGTLGLVIRLENLHPSLERALHGQEEPRSGKVESSGGHHRPKIPDA